jgi:sarcosine oxidase, subunit alpha
MTGRPYRLPASAAAGRLIDRSKPLAFTFDGRRMTGFAGDTLASAVLANGRALFGRSFKYHRPRGLVGLGSEEPSALVGVGEGARHEPNLRATQLELHDGMTAVSQNRWPSLDWDIGVVNGWISRVIPAGFYYKTLKWPQSFWKSVYEPLIRRAAGLGTAPTGRDPDSYEQMHAYCDVLVVGAGVAGLAAAEAAAASGARVIIADENPRFGGLADIAGGTIDGGPQLDWVNERVCALAASETGACSAAHHRDRPLPPQLPADVRAPRRSRPGAAGTRHAAPSPVEGASEAGGPGDWRHRAPDPVCQQRPARHHAGLDGSRPDRALGCGAGAGRRRLHQQ